MFYTDELLYAHCAKISKYPDNYLSMPFAPCDLIDAASNILLLVLMYRIFRTIMRKFLLKKKLVLKDKDEEKLPVRPNLVCPEKVVTIESMDYEDTFTETASKGIKNQPTPCKDLIAPTIEFSGTQSSIFEDGILSGKDTSNMTNSKNEHIADLNRNINTLDSSFAKSDSFDRPVNFDDFSETSFVVDSFLESNESSNFSLMSDSSEEYGSESTDEYDEESSATSNGSEESDFSASTSASEESESSATSGSEVSDSSDSETSDSSDTEAVSEGKEERPTVPPRRCFVTHPISYDIIMEVRNTFQPRCGHYFNSFSSKTFPCGCRMSLRPLTTKQVNPYRLVRHQFYSNVVWRFGNRQANDTWNSNVPTTAEGDSCNQRNEFGQSTSNESVNVKTHSGNKTNESIMKSSNGKEHFPANIGIFSAMHATKKEANTVVHQTKDDVNQIVNPTEADVNPTVHATEADVNQIVNATESDVIPSVHTTEADVNPTVHTTEAVVNPNVHPTENYVHKTTKESNAATNVEVSATVNPTEVYVVNIRDGTRKELKNVDEKVYSSTDPKTSCRSDNNSTTSLDVVPIEFLYQCTQR